VLRKETACPYIHSTYIHSLLQKGTVPQPFHFHSSLRSTVIQEIKDNEKSTDEPFISLASRIKQFEENIAGRGYEHSLKDKDVSRIGLCAYIH
jgi:hypothetical protein